MTNIFDKILLKIILIVHITIVIFVVLTPFINSNYLLLLHSMIIPFIVLHWLMNNNMCALTLMEKKIREKISGSSNAKKECFTCKIIEPIYDFKNNHKERSTFIYASTAILWLISVSRLYYKYKIGEITKFKDLMQF